MKRTLLFVIFLCCTFLKLIAQGPTLTSANSTPVVGEQIFNRFAQAANVDDKSGGANQTWDYSNLIDSNGIIGAQVVTPASTPYQGSFPTSNLAIKTLDDSAYLYFNSQTTELRELGAATNSATLIYTKPKIYLPYPFSYNSFFTDSVVEQSPQYNAVLRGKDSLTGDGYGTLKLPGITYSNVLRVKYIENVTSTQDTLGGTLTLNLRTISYLYYTPDTHAPLLSNQTTEARFTLIVLGFEIDSISFSKDVSYLTGNILPLSFTSFNASLNNNEVVLNWQTAQEINTNYFNVQRSLTGNNFTDIAEVKATGSSSVARYNYVDQDYVKPGVPPSVFYRIKETDKDGKEFYSDIKVVHGTAGNISLYPNPVTNYINFKGSSVAEAISIYDAKGHLVKQFTNYQLSNPIDVSRFSKGSYFVQIKMAGKTTTTTIVKE